MAVYIVALDSGTHADATAAESAITGAGASITKTYKFNLTYKIDCTSDQLAAIAGVTHSSLESATEDITIQFDQTHLKYLCNNVASNLNKNYDPQYEGYESSVYLLDTGVNTAHTEFSSANTIALHSMYQVDGNPDNSDSTGHGTAMASLINGGNVGVSPKSNVYSIKVMNDVTTTATVGHMLEAMDVALEHHLDNTPAKVKAVCLPWTTSKNALLDSKLEEMETHNMLVICSAGNNAADADNYSPAGLDQVMTVGAHNPSYVVGGFGANATWSGGSAGSNLGEEVDIYSIGSNVSIAQHSDNVSYGTSYGTSPATAIIAGLSAQYVEKTPTATATQIKSFMVSGGDRVGRGANLTFDANLITSTGANVDLLKKSIGVSPQKTDVNLSTLPTGLVIAVKNGESGTVNVGLNENASNVQVLAFSPVPPFASFDTSTGVISVDTSANMSGVTVPGKYHFAVRGEIASATKVEEYTIGVYTTEETELDSSNEYYYDGSSYDQVVNFTSTKE
tara:strand:+ start:16 stop:1539 length:1524 start_codon:yes stop_codon:yes gene_type:complete